MDQLMQIYLECPALNFLLIVGTNPRIGLVMAGTHTPTISLFGGNTSLFSTISYKQSHFLDLRSTHIFKTLMIITEQTSMVKHFVSLTVLAIYGPI